MGSRLTDLFAHRAALGFDFDPTNDRIRITDSAGQNIQINPTTGAQVDLDPLTPALDADTPLAYVPGDASAGKTPHVVGSAYTNNFNLATPVTLYDIDSNLDALVRQGSVGGTVTSPTTGQLFTVGASGQKIPDQVGFDVITQSNTDQAFAVFAARGGTGLYSVNHTTGAFTLASTLGKKVKGVVGFAVQTGQ
jgi:hypothetical protein